MLTPTQRAWSAVGVTPALGRECPHYKWNQNQTHVLVYLLLPESVSAKQAST